MESLTPIRIRIKRENPQSTKGVIEFQLDGSGIASVACDLRKEAWIITDQVQPPVDAGDANAGTAGGSNTQTKKPAPKPAPSTKKRKR